jgi:hypothetical protein
MVTTMPSINDAIEQNNTSELRKTVLSVLERRLQTLGFQRLELVAGEDYEGDDVLYIDLYFDLIEPALDPELFNFLTTELREALQRIGEYRFPHLRYHFDERQKVAGWR